MGNAPSTPTKEQAEELQASLATSLDRAAAAIAQADVLLLATGAGWSADSGLAVYKDVANIQAYHERDLSYHDLCDPSWLDKDPSTFHGFWGSCFNDYRAATPHDGYKIIRRWRDRFFEKTEVAADLRKRSAAKEAAGAFFCHTSNVDAHSYGAFETNEIRECHGNSETWQCADGCECQGMGDAETKGVGRRWKAPAGFRFKIDASTMLAPKGVPIAGEHNGFASAIESEGFTQNWPTCKHCGGAARPSILMFGDSRWVDDHEQAARWQNWRTTLLELAEEGDKHEPLRVVVLEVGAGGNVTTIRNLGESLVEKLLACHARPTLIRVNPDLPLADRAANQARTISLPCYGLEAVKQIDTRIENLLATGLWQQAAAEPPTLSTVPIEEDSQTQEDSQTPKGTQAATTITPSTASLTEQNRVEIKTIFDAVDKDKSGRLDSEEVRSAAMRLGRFLLPNEVEEGMAEMDTNGDGTVDFDEFADWWWRSGRLSAFEKLEAKWSAFSKKFDALTTAAVGRMGGA
eukprot:SAG31_NODE_41_length_31342_cov_8.029286_24_plen_519_part_00